jgi:hypothetical protein
MTHTTYNALLSRNSPPLTIPENALNPLTVIPSAKDNVNKNNKKDAPY